MEQFIHNIIHHFLVSFGIVAGASSCASLAALVCNKPPLKTMIDVAISLKIWAVAVSLGGTFSSFEALEQGIFKGELKAIIRQLTYIIAALCGANIGQSLVILIKRCGQLWTQ